MENILSNFASMISSNIWLALLMSLVAGVVSSFSPCVLSSLPLVLGYVEGYAGNDKKAALKYSIIFSVGVTVTFTTLGILSAVLGRLLSGAGRWWYLVLSFIMLLSGLQLLEVLNIKNNSHRVTVKRRGVAGAFFLGILGGVLSSPCSTPVLAAMLTFVASEGNILLGIAMLLLYSVGHSTLIIIAGTSVGIIESLNSSSRTLFIGKILKYLVGTIVLILGLYLFYLGL